MTATLLLQLLYSILYFDYFYCCAYCFFTVKTTWQTKKNSWSLILWFFHTKSVVLLLVFLWGGWERARRPHAIRRTKNECTVMVMWKHKAINMEASTKHEPITSAVRVRVRSKYPSFSLGLKKRRRRNRQNVYYTELLSQIQNQIGSHRHSESDRIALRIGSHRITRTRSN